MSSPPPPSRWYARHLDEVGESYVGHAAFALAIAARCAWAALLLVVHALLPFLLERDGSSILQRIQDDIAARAAMRRKSP